MASERSFVSSNVSFVVVALLASVLVSIVYVAGLEGRRKHEIPPVLERPIRRRVRALAAGKRIAMVRELGALRLASDGGGLLRSRVSRIVRARNPVGVA